MFIEIEKYIEESREKRREHLILSEVCIVIGGDSRNFKGLLAHFLKTTIPYRNHKIQLCHACHNDKCSNVRHLYWGTAYDNHLDQRENGTHTSVHERMKLKYTEDELKQIYQNAGRLGGQKSQIGERSFIYNNEKLAEVRIILDECEVEKIGWIKRVQSKLNLSHTQIARLVKQHFPDLKVYKRKSQIYEE